MNKYYRVLALALVCSLAACNQNQPKENTDKPASQTATESKGVNVKLAELASTKDYVCGMTLAEGEIGDTASYDQKLYGFCSKECKAEFEKNPTSYLTQK